MQLSSSLQTVVRRRLEAPEEPALGGVYAGNPGRKTKQPTTPMLLRALRGISAVFIPDNKGYRVQLTPLTAQQQRILDLAQAGEVYQRLADVLRTQVHICET